MPNPHSTPRARSWRSRLSSNPALITEITASPIATATWLLTQYEVGAERRPKQAGILGTLYMRMQHALTKLAGHKCPEAKELKRLLRIYKSQIKIMPMFVPEEEILRLSTGDADSPEANRDRMPCLQHKLKPLEDHPSADFHEENTKAFLKAAFGAHKRGDMREDTMIHILLEIQTHREIFETLYGNPDDSPQSVTELHHKLDTLELLLAPVAGHA